MRETTVALSGVAFPLQVSPAALPTAFWLLLFGLYVAFLLISLWVYQDARLRGMHGPFWLAVVFLAPIVGLVGYVIFRRERPG